MFRFSDALLTAGADHVWPAVQAALEMRANFERLKQSWSDSGFDVGSVFSRIGLAFGPVYEVGMGHASRKEIVVIGPAVSRAAHLCERAPDGDNIVLVDQDIADRIQSKPNVHLSPLKLGGGDYETTAYAIRSESTD